MRKQAAFDQIGLRSQIHKDTMDYRNRLLAFDQKKFKKGMRQRKSNLRGQIGVGIGTGLLSAFEGRRQAQELAKTNALAQARHDETMSLLRQQVKIRMGV
jgi:hypothetical protein